MKKPEDARRIAGAVFAGTVVLASGAILLWNKFQTPAPQDTLPQALPDGTFGAPGSLSPLAGPMFPANGRILVVGGEVAAGLGTALVPVMTGIEQLNPKIPATPQIVSVWDGQGVTSYESFAHGVAAGIPDAAKNLDGLGAPDVLVVMVGEYDASKGAQGDIVSSVTTMVQGLEPIVRNHYPNILWVLPWAGPHAVEQSLLVAGTLAKSALGRVVPFLPKASSIAMDVRVIPGTGGFPGFCPDGTSYDWSSFTCATTEEWRPSVSGYTDLAQQVAAILLEWWLKGNA